MGELEQQTALSDVLPGSRPTLEYAFEKLAKKVAQDFRALGKIPEQKAAPRQKELEISLDNFITEMLLEWARVIHAERPVRFDTVDALKKAKRNADALKRNIDELLLKLEEETRWKSEEAVAIISAATLIPNEINRIGMLLGTRLDFGNLQREWTSLVKPNLLRRRRGRRREHTIDGLRFLISEMERFARGSGGKGFAMPSTRPKKGRIIEMIDRLRKHLVDDPGFRWLAEFLPPPGTHPIWVYQLAIKEGRTAYTEQDPEGFF
jgi:hypothetical protein